MIERRCRCTECRAGDAFPDRLQGWPGAYQLAMPMPSSQLGEIHMVQDPCRTACQNRCAEFGEPACYEVLEGEWHPCDNCKRDCGIEVVEPIDPHAVIGQLL